MTLRSTRCIIVSLLLVPLGATAQNAHPFPGVPIPMNAPCPSVVGKVITDAKLVLGTYPLATEKRAVVDGDTIRVDGLKQTLRLLGIDTEETFKDVGRRALAARDWGEYLKTIYAGTKTNRPPKFGTPFGEAAKDFTERFFKGVEKVRLEYDDPARTRGYFNRHLVHVLSLREQGWVNFNVEIVRQGLSPYFVKYGRCTRYHTAFLEAEKLARDSRRGMWAQKPAYSCYPDYPVRLLWWLERDRDLQVVKILRKKAADLFVLGEDADWKSLIGSEGREVRVAGVPGRLIRRGKLGLQTVGHRNRQDFIIVGDVDKLAAMGFDKNAGDMMLFTGKVSLHKGRPQFRLEDLRKFERLPQR